MYLYQYNLHNLDEPAKVSILGESLLFISLRAWTSEDTVN